MRKIAVFLLVACMLFVAAGCDRSEASEEIFVLPGYGLEITADSNFYENTGGSFDLQITNDKCYVSVMAYHYADLPLDTTTYDAYEIQNEDLFGKRDEVTVIEETKTQGTITYGVHSAKKDGVENYYATYLLDFPESEIFAWVLITSTPTYYMNNTEYLHNIVCSLVPVV